MKGLILLNLGTPDDANPEAVGRYLREFLMDPDVIDVPYLLRAFLVKILIVPRRKHASAEAYRKVWTPDGSPLALFHHAFCREVARILEGDFKTVSAMRYGKPSVEKAFLELKEAGITDVTVLPLYPQYSLAATRSSKLEATRVAARLGFGPPKFLGAFYDAPEFLDAFTDVIGRSLSAKPWDRLIFSFHGLPERQVKNTDRSPGRTYCLKSATCCDTPCDANRDCYRHQSYETARAIAKRLNLRPDQYAVSFQSRLTKAWIRPFTDELFDAYPKQGVKKVAVACPAFVADCLETLEEIAIRGKESFQAAGGEDLFLIPSLNVEPLWTQGVAKLVRRLAL